MNLLVNRKIVGVYIFLEKRKSRQFVGELAYDAKKNKYVFTYSQKYLFSNKIIPIGPELPLTQKQFISSQLFPSFSDRIPDKDNPAYRDYCHAMGISEKESNPIILLSTIGRRGPSSLVFEPHYEKTFDKNTLKSFREALGLTTREFAECFDITQSALVNIEQGKLSGKEILKRIEIYYMFPEVAIFQIKMSGSKIHSDKQKNIISKIKAKFISQKK